jgi:uncharacterized membrane-anchored protein
VADKDIPAFMALHWQRALNVNLPLSRSFIRELPGSVIVTGPEAITAGKLLGLGNIGNAEALTFDPTTQMFVIFYYAPIGFASTSNWTTIDDDRLLHKTEEITETENAHRRLAGTEEVHVIDWIQKPILNPETQTVSWVIKVDEAGNFISNVVALKLGRYGFERLTFADQADDVFAINRKLESVLNALEFHNGARYSDYVPGLDRNAVEGVSGIVNDTILGRAVSGAAVGIMAPIFAALAKASIGLILLPVYWLFKAGRQIIAKTNSET